MKLELRGSENDKIIWNFKPFKVGHSFWLPQKKNEKIKNIEQTIILKVPYRVVPTVLDLTRLSPTGTKQLNYGGGEIAIAINPKLEIKLKIRKDNKIIINGTDREVIIKHAVLLFRKIVHKNFGVDIQIKKEIKLTHMGLGSSAVVFSGILLGLNKLFNNLLSKDELSKVVAFNYGEEYRNSKNFLVPGFTTLGAFWSALNGGINIVSGDFKLAFHEKFPTNVKCLLGYPKLNKNEKIEFTLEHAKKGFKINTMDVVRHFDKFDAAKKCYWILMDFIPAAREKNIKKMGEVIWNIEIDTIHLIPLIITRGRFEVFHLLSELYFNGAEITFLTSGGPSIFVASNKLDYKDMEKIFKKYGYETLKVSVDNKGLEVNYV